jgi:NADPH-dependent glutamate synthase beta subunit-like oxidoreductase/dihydroorotate dehydrogenase
MYTQQYKESDFQLPVKVAGLTFRNPFFVSSGPTTMTIEQLRKIQEMGWGGASLKLTIDPTPYINRHPRYGYFPDMNFLSFTAERRIELDEACRLMAKGRKECPELILFSNITYSGDKGAEGWVNMAKKFEEAGAHANELNMCCPNMSYNLELSGKEDSGGPKTGASLGQNPEALKEIITAIKSTTSIPLFVKITPEGGRLPVVAKICLEAGADMVGSNSNRLAIPKLNLDDPTHSTYFLQKEIGMACMCGEWLHPLSKRDVYEIRRMVGPDPPLFATGGVSKWDHAIELFMSGADIIGISAGTLIYGFGLLPELISGVKQFIKEKGYKSPRDFRDIIIPAITAASDLTIYEGKSQHIDPHLAAPCRYACSAGVLAQDYVRAVARRDFKATFDIITLRDPMQAICAKICPAPCEDECTRGELDESIRIRDIKRFVIETAKKNNWIPKMEITLTRNEKVAIIGAGPAGLTAARDLALAGYKITIYEASDKAGGMLRTAIPEFRLSDEDVDYEVDNVKRLGVEFKMNMSLGKEIQLKDLQKQYDAVFLAIGASKGLMLGIEGEDAQDYYTALDFLHQIETGDIKNVGKNVMVIGAGDTGMDIARTAKRLGATNILVAEIMDKDDLRKSQEVIEAVEEGIQLLYLNSITQIIKKDNKVAGVKMHPYVLNKKNKGPGVPEPVKSTDYEVPIDMVINAVGQQVAIDLKDMGFKIGKRGVVITDTAKGKTNIKKVFAAGDVANGQGTIIEAVAQAKNAAASIDKLLANKAAVLKHLPKLTQVDKTKVLERKGNEPRKNRVSLDSAKPEKRLTGFNEFTRVLTESEAVKEAERCLACGCGTGCGICVDICKMFAWERDEDRVVLDDEKCVACGMCIWRCPNDNIEMEKTSKKPI